MPIKIYPCEDSSYVAVEFIYLFLFFIFTDKGDKNPCSDEETILSTTTSCASAVDLSGFNVNGDSNNSFGLTQQNCG